MIDRYDNRQWVNMPQQAYQADTYFYGWPQYSEARHLLKTTRQTAGEGSWRGLGVYFQFLFPVEITISPSPRPSPQRSSIGLGCVYFLHKHKHLSAVLLSWKKQLVDTVLSEVRSQDIARGRERKRWHFNGCSTVKSVCAGNAGGLPSLLC